MRVIELFKEITAIPRCSGTHQPFIEFIQQFAAKNNYKCQVDNAKNILCFKADTTAKICLQSHYDIVCLEDGKVPQIVEEDGYLRAKDSTLGADNGIGCAYMLALMEEQADIEALFTSDEEIGLIGANNLELTITSKVMLNLDSEDQGEICIGCAGGVDIFATNSNAKLVQNIDNKQLYEITIENLDGGHSGVDIDKNIPNALKLIAKSIKECGGELLDLNGGERINSIPKKAKAIIVSEKTPAITHEKMTIKKLDSTTEHYNKLDSKIIDFIYSFANGVRGYDKELEVVLSSINLAIVKNNIDALIIELSARSMNNEDLKILTNETLTLLDIFGFTTTTNGKYPAWKPSHSEFTSKVLDIYKKHDANATLNAVHAGLECAIFKAKYPEIDVCSIGPNIYFPHSHREECEISSVGSVYKIVKEIITSL